MDPFTQRMLERARLRQEKSKLASRNPHEPPKKQSPLKENNHTLKIKTEVEVTLSSLKAKETVSNAEVSPQKGETATAVYQDEVSKENTCIAECSKDNAGSNVIRDKVRSRLKRLGALYADSQLSSPIHQTEASFSAEQDRDPLVDKDPQTQELAKLKSGRSIAKLAALANNMKEWEDDLSHPNISSAVVNAVNEHGQTQTTSSHDKHNHQGSTTTAVWKQTNDVCNALKEDKGPKHVNWDKAIIETLEAQGFSRTQSNSRLVYDYAKRSSQDTSTAAEKASAKQEQSSFKRFNEVGSLSQDHRTARDNAQGSHLNKVNISPVKGNFLKDSNCAHTPPTPKMGIQVLSPSKSPKTGSVLHRAALFESNNSAITTAPKVAPKDPTELTISERKALFEQNKGEALIPKTAFSMPVPPKYLLNKEKNAKNVFPEKENRSTKRMFPAPLKDETSQGSAEPTIRTGISKTIAKLFECGAAAINTTNRELAESDQSARQRELEVLANRWNTNKKFASNNAEIMKDNTNETIKSIANTPPAPPMPEMNRVNTSPLRDQQLPKQPIGDQNTSKAKLQAPALKQQYPGMDEIKRIKVSPPKPGHLYPCLSDIEATTETETEMDTQNEYEYSTSDTSDENIGNTSFGREILQAAGLQNSPISKSVRNDSMSSDEGDSENAVFEDMDNFLNEALSDDSDSDIPTPPKKTRSASKLLKKGTNEERRKSMDSSSSSSQSHSFKYARGYNNPENPKYVEEGNEQVPLMHTVSFYRRQQNLAVKSNCNNRQVVHESEPQVMDTPRDINWDSQEDIRKKICDLLEEVSKQQAIISQASQALNLCCSTVEFSGSTEQVEGERLLLVATHRRQVALNEVQRLKVEGTLKPGGSNPELMERGSLIVSNITVPLKRDYLRSMAADETCYHFVCLLRAQEQVAVTPAVAASSDNLRSGGGICVIFPGSLRLDGLYSDFKATLEIYSLQTRREILPHDIKYHISNKKENGSSSKLRLTPKKLKQESKLIMPSVQSPAGPSAVRTTAFQLSGYVVFSLRELRRTQFTLNKVAFSSPLEGSISLQLNSELQLEVSQKGFLTMFEDVSGFGAWHRRWCMLSGHFLSYWKYPDDENKKVPIGQIDLNTCSTETVGLVSRDICARPNTFLLETKRPSSPYDEESLVLVKQGDFTIIRHLLSADTKEDRIIWCTQINKALAMLKAWGAKNKSY